MANIENWEVATLDESGNLALDGTLTATGTVTSTGGFIGSLVTPAATAES